MKLLQLTAGQGPEECALAVAKAFNLLQVQGDNLKVTLQILEAVETKSGGMKSILLQVDGENASHLISTWTGSLLWVCQSPYRPKHKRKNWFFSGVGFEFDEIQLDQTVSYQACRASGAGGQHVNKTDSAIRATHVETGVSVRVESERSQHANKRLARGLLFQKLETLKQDAMTAQEKQRWLQHKTLERGNAVQVFEGEIFKAIPK